MAEDADEFERSFVNDSGDDDKGQAINYRAINNELNNTAAQLPQHYRRSAVSEGEDDVIYTRVKPEDPDVYRVMVARGKHMLCAYAMYHAVQDAGLKYASQLQAYRYEVISVSASPADPEAVYVESFNPRDVERLAGHAGLRALVLPFRRSYNPQPVTKRAVLLKAVRKLDRDDEQPAIFTRRRDSELEFKRSQLVVVRKSGFGNPLRGQLARVYDVDHRAARLTLVSQTPYRSLVNREKTNHHRITIEEYRELGREADYYQPADFPSGQYLEGLLVSTVRFEDVETNVPLAQQQNRQLLSLRNANHAADIKTLIQNSSLKPLNMDDVVIINNYMYDGQDLTGSQGVVRELHDDYVYGVEVLKSAVPGLERQTLMVERFQMIKHVASGAHIRVDDGPFQGLTGRVYKTLLTPDMTQLLVEFNADITNELVDQSYKITTDDVILSQDKFQGLKEKLLPDQNRLFKQHQLIRTDDGIEGIVTYLLH